MGQSDEWLLIYGRKLAKLVVASKTAFLLFSSNGATPKLKLACERPKKLKNRELRRREKENERGERESGLSSPSLRFFVFFRLAVHIRLVVHRLNQSAAATRPYSRNPGMSAQQAAQT